MPSDLERIQGYLRRQARRGRAAQALAGFTVYAPAQRDAEETPYAIPRRVTRRLRDADLDELHAAFQRHGARPQVEFLANLFANLPARLVAAGYQETRRQPALLAHLGDILLPQAPARAELVTLSHASSLAEAREGWETNARGFGESGKPSEHEVKAFRADLVSGRAFTLRVDGRPVAAGMFETIRGGVTELLGIATLPEERRRGYGGYLTAAMAESAIAHGATLVFLCAASDEAGRVYERVGFRRCAALVEYARE
jgi:ribosomal protein S18 acetylase RimI-like enzyme